MDIFEPEATGRNSAARERKEILDIGWCPNDHNFGGFAAVHSDFSVKGPKRAFLGPRGPGVNFFPNIGKWGIQSGARICPDHTALFRSI